MTIQEAIETLTLREYEVIGRPESADELLLAICARAEDVQRDPDCYNAQELEAANTLLGSDIRKALNAANEELAEWDAAEEKAATKQQH